VNVPRASTEGRTRLAYRAAKRSLDVACAAVGLVLLSPVLATLALAVRVSSKGPVLFRQRRTGRNGATFEILKFRSMRPGVAGPSVTASGDERITGVGRLLRKTKLDELPQLWNVLVGDMSLVGPRPELPRFVARFPSDYARILAVRPGITDYAALEYLDEETLLACPDPESTYLEHVLPAKIVSYHRYLDRMSLRTDLGILVRTAARLLRGPDRRSTGSPSPPARSDRRSSPEELRRLSAARLHLTAWVEPLVRIAASVIALSGREVDAVEQRLRGRLLGGAAGWRVGRGVRFVGPPARFLLGPRVTLYGETYLNAGGPAGRIEVGPDTHVDVGCVLYGQGGLLIGGNCAIASGVIIYSQTNHDSLGDGTPVTQQPVRYAPVVIRDGCWLGAGVRVIPGVTLGPGAHVGAGAVVTRDLSERVVAVGVPARPIRGGTT
jgi:lipopolysaccharide/colanic/teichoic acid biosynthesis glycosyltransferase/acetyltransferase-like isoleucine patch superfamily enzyme